MAVDPGRATIISAVIAGVAAIAVAVVTVAVKSDDNSTANKATKSPVVAVTTTAVVPPPTTTDGGTTTDDTGPAPDFTKDLKIPLLNYMSIFLRTGEVVQGKGTADLYYGPQRSIRTSFSQLSSDVEARTKAGCEDAVATRPAGKSITKLDTGQAICVVPSSLMAGGGVALLVVTSAPDSSGTIGLRLSYWS
ncbi:hypothetical protein GCM10010172_17480 [Paractinoplanes ferrugineus]|uniref:Uncharacterized protein n=1 Tax=Paractinoplanes ferrugineus TaxID=113564 RepID=A0A919MEG2_9ACTN|nr:hypothetical protein [Actinoplanes ferrugineus]GIE11644.1 hypothetical protein Afe05nite_34840 [Actinoplanes ferrugineus]